MLDVSKIRFTAVKTHRRSESVLQTSLSIRGFDTYAGLFSYLKRPSTDVLSINRQLVSNILIKCMVLATTSSMLCEPVSRGPSVLMLLSFRVIPCMPVRIPRFHAISIAGCTYLAWEIQCRAPTAQTGSVGIRNVLSME